MNQTQATFGFTVDPDDPRHAYMGISEPHSGYGVLRFLVDYDKGTWKLDAVWPHIGGYWDNFPGGPSFPPSLIFTATST